MRLALQRTPWRPFFWHGTLFQDKRDAVGLHYRRNRYLDANTGRFTQEDPIGLAGALNAYGFANGDPVNFSDPFGLCPLPASACPPGYFTALGAASGLGAGVLVASGCTVGTGGLCVLGAPAIIGGLTSVGTTVGVAADAIAQNADALSTNASEIGDKIGRKVQRALETIGFIVGLITMEPPPKKPDDEKGPPPPVPTSPKSMVPSEREEP